MKTKNIRSDQTHHKIPDLPVALLYGVGLLIAIYLGMQSYLCTPPNGIHPLKDMDLHQIQGPWFEIARLKSVSEKELHDPMMFIKYAGVGADSFYSYPDPSDTRFRIILMGQSFSGSRVTAFDTMSFRVSNYQSSTLVLPCYYVLACAFHIIEYDRVNHTWMVVTGHNKQQLWIFSRGPGILPEIIEELQKRLSDLGYEVHKLAWSNKLPTIPDTAPAIPNIPPTPPSAQPLLNRSSE